jgi:hypothetical protein
LCLSGVVEGGVLCGTYRGRTVTRMRERGANWNGGNRQSKLTKAHVSNWLKLQKNGALLAVYQPADIYLSPADLNKRRRSFGKGRVFTKGQFQPAKHAGGRCAPPFP